MLFIKINFPIISYQLYQLLIAFFFLYDFERKITVSLIKNSTNTKFNNKKNSKKFKSLKLIKESKKKTTIFTLVLPT